VHSELFPRRKVKTHHNYKTGWKSHAYASYWVSWGRGNEVYAINNVLIISHLNTDSNPKSGYHWAWHSEKGLETYSEKGKIAASVWLQLFISGNDKCHSIDAQYLRCSGKYFKVKEIFLKYCFFDPSLHIIYVSRIGRLHSYVFGPCIKRFINGHQTKLFGIKTITSNHQHRTSMDYEAFWYIFTYLISRSIEKKTWYYIINVIQRCLTEVLCLDFI